MVYITKVLHVLLFFGSHWGEVLLLVSWSWGELFGWVLLVWFVLLVCIIV